MNLSIRLVYLFFLTALTAGCSAIKNSQYYEYLSTTTEDVECLYSYSYTSTNLVTGTAKFYKRGLVPTVQYNSTTSTNDLKNLTLGNPLATALPIKYAEIVVYNSKNKIVQCGLTNSSGALKGLDGTSDLLIPNTTDTYTVKVLARTNIAFSVGTKPTSINLHASIKKDKYTNKVQNIQKSSYSNGTDPINFDLYAYARQTDSIEIEGGAFNILNSIFETYNYLNSNTGSVDLSCLNEKVNVYWKAGFNPYQYLIPTADPSYLPSNSYYNSDGDKTLNITGGRLGNVSLENTDHFDDFVIIHELGHFIEDHCGRLASPGGTHAILSRIDPRLAWSEGWSNYLAAQVMANAITNINPEFSTQMTSVNLPTAWTYFSSTIGFADTIQNVGNANGFMFDLKKSGTNPDTWQTGSYTGSYFDKINATSYPGEGHFREGAITRGLFKLTNACGTTCATSPISFETVWKSVDKITGVGTAAYVYKSSHDVISNIRTLAAGAWAGDNQTKSQSEALHVFNDGGFTSGSVHSWIPYGAYLTTTSPTACGFGEMNIQPRIDDPVLAGTTSDQRYSNHYYTIDLSILSSVSEINVTFTSLAGTATEFDLLLFKENYTYNMDYSCSSTDILGNCLTSWQPSRTITNDVVRYDRRAGTSVTTKRLTNLQALSSGQKYLLNIRAYTPAKSIAGVTNYKYEIKDQSGNYICP